MVESGSKSLYWEQAHAERVPIVVKRGHHNSGDIKIIRRPEQLSEESKQENYAMAKCTGWFIASKADTVERGNGERFSKSIVD